MNYAINSAWLPKKGNKLTEYEDALYPKESGLYNEKQTVTIAVSDGASESLLSGQWAELLVRLCCKDSSIFENLDLFIKKACRGWKLWLKCYLRTRERNFKPIKWFEEPGLASGAFASLICMKAADGNDVDKNQWEAISLGDSCLFQVREDKMIISFPVSSSSEFNNRPYLLASNPQKNSRIMMHAQKITGKWKKNDTFFLMTDALAAWFLKQVEDGETPWISILDSETTRYEDSLKELVESLRERGAIRNDDVSVIRLDLR